MLKCPYPGCDHLIAYMLTHNHCETVHGMTKANLIKRYGQPKPLKVDHNALIKNLAMHRVITKSELQM
jgi:hypothetical protein